MPPWLRLLLHAVYRPACADVAVLVYVAGEPGIRSRWMASDMETDETGRWLPFTIMPTKRCGPGRRFNAMRAARTHIVIAAHGTVSPIWSNKVKSVAGA